MFVCWSWASVRLALHVAGDFERNGTVGQLSLTSQEHTAKRTATQLGTEIEAKKKVLPPREEILDASARSWRRLGIGLFQLSKSLRRGWLGERTSAARMLPWSESIRSVSFSSGRGRGAPWCLYDGPALGMDAEAFLIFGRIGEPRPPGSESDIRQTPGRADVVAVLEQLRKTRAIDFQADRPALALRAVLHLDADQFKKDGALQRIARRRQKLPPA